MHSHKIRRKKAINQGRAAREKPLSSGAQRRYHTRLFIDGY